MLIANAERVTRNCVRDIAQQFQNWLKNFARVTLNLVRKRRKPGIEAVTEENEVN